MDTPAGHNSLIPAAPSPRFARVFGWYNRRLVRRSFHALSVDTSTLALARGLDADDRPVILLINHVGWWDPLIMLEFRRMLWPSRTGIAPIDAAQLARFGFMRKLGLFGIDPDDPRSLEAMLEYTLAFFAATPRASLCITPQGRFSDPREPIRLRPGAAAIAARAPDIRVACLALEYAFWQDKRPELLARFAEVPMPGQPTTAAWHRAMTAMMQDNAATLAQLVIARDQAPFTNLLGDVATRINPVYDLYLRLRGRRTAISAHRVSVPSHID